LIFLRLFLTELFFLVGDTTQCRQVKTSTTDTEWATQSCVLSFETIGIWPESADGTDINTVAKSNDSELLATGDDYGKVNLFSYPAMQPKVS
jgi:echinoderm microtubule-associated protein-like 1/2